MNWSVRRPLTQGLAALFILLGGLGSWSVLAEISGAVMAYGAVTMVESRRAVQHPLGGVVLSQDVSEGGFVEQGEVLIRLEEEDLRANLAIIESQLFELLARRSRLEAERDGRRELTFDPLLEAAPQDFREALIQGQHALLEARRATEQTQLALLENREEQIAAQIAGAEVQLRSLQLQLDLLEQDLANQRTLLDRGLTAASELRALEREAARLSGQMGALAAEIGTDRERIIELNSERNRLDAQRHEDLIAQLHELQTRELQLREQQQSLVRHLSLNEIQAPISGQIYGLQIFGSGTVISPGEILFYIIPTGSAQLVEARVLPADIDALQLGQKVNLRFSTLNRGNTPEVEGEIRTISTDAFADERSGARYFRIEIELTKTALENLGENTALISGMPVEVFVKTEARAPLSYLTRPLTDYFARTFNDI